MIPDATTDPYVCSLLACDGLTHVIDTRPTRKGVRRRRECLTCKHRFSTYEIPAEDIDGATKVRTLRLAMKDVLGI